MRLSLLTASPQKRNNLTASAPENLEGRNKRQLRTGGKQTVIYALDTSA